MLFVNWDVDPVIFHIGSFQLRYYGLLFIVGFYLGYYMFRHFFRRENKPEGAPKRCIEGCPYAKTCIYNAVKRYYDDKQNAWFRNAAAMAAQFDNIATDEEIERALRETPYGYCVYDSDNTVVDHQTVNMEFEGGVLVTFTS